MQVVINNSPEQFPVLFGLNPKILLTESKPYSADCQIKAANDLQAINAWLTQHNENKHTKAAYSREAKRLLLWCIYEKGRTLAQLKMQDFEDYFDFLKNPPPTWCITRGELTAGNKAIGWKPFVGPLNQAAFNMAIRVINSLMNYLVESDYLRSNPLKLIKKHTKFSFDLKLHKYKVKARMLEEDEWAAVQAAINDLPTSDDKELHNKMHTQFLCALLYLLGLRIHEVANATWNAFQKVDNNWLFFVQGKGGKFADVEVNEQMLDFIKVYRLYCGKTPFPSIDETESLFFSKKTKKPRTIRQLYELIKTIGKLAAKSFPDNLSKQRKLQQLSPHWLRHLSASHQAKLNIPTTVIQSQLRHSTAQITQIYLHTEEELRAREMQKLQMAMVPKLIMPIKAETITAITLTIKGSPVSEVFNLARLLDAIENNILLGITWNSSEPSRETLLKKYEQLHIYKMPLQIRYNLHNVREDELNHIGQAISREADIRLFSCSIKVTSINI